MAKYPFLPLFQLKLPNGFKYEVLVDGDGNVSASYTLEIGKIFLPSFKIKWNKNFEKKAKLQQFMNGE